MPSLKDIKNRISSVENTLQITKAMKMVAASKLRKAQTSIEQARPYSDKLKGIVSNLNQSGKGGTHPLLQNRDQGKARILLITSDKGLCGGLNNNLSKKTLQFVKNEASKFSEISLIPFGKKGYDFFKSRDFLLEYASQQLHDSEQKKYLLKLIKKLIFQYEKKEFNHLYIAFNEFQSVLTQTPQIKKLLPLEIPNFNLSSTEWIFEPTAESIFNSLLPKYIENQVYTALLDNLASEHGSRMTAMDAANRNASEMIDKLRLQYNRIRQAAITTELTEIISGAESIQ